MRIVQLGRLVVFVEKHADAAGPLDAWVQTTSRAAWRNLLDVRKTYRHADAVKLVGKTVTIFNIKGNHYRLITAIDYAIGAVNVLDVFTHAEYSKNRWKETI